MRDPNGGAHRDTGRPTSVEQHLSPRPPEGARGSLLTAVLPPVLSEQQTLHAEQLAALPGRGFAFNAYDEFALEEALRLKDAKKASKVIVFTVGGKDAEARVRDALARGADDPEGEPVAARRAPPPARRQFPPFFRRHRYRFRGLDPKQQQRAHSPSSSHAT